MVRTSISGKLKFNFKFCMSQFDKRNYYYLNKSIFHKNFFESSIKNKNKSNDKVLNSIENETDSYNQFDNIKDEETEKLNYDFISKQYLHLENNQGINSVLKNMKCQGCGIELQIENKNKIGFIPEKKFLDFLNGKNTLEKLENNTSNINHVNNIMNSNEDNENIIKDTQESNSLNNISEFEHIHDKSTLKKIMKLKNNKSSLICERCFKLKNYLKFEDLNKKDNNLDKVNNPTEKNTISSAKEKLIKNKEQERIENYASIIKQINPQRLIHQIMARISNKAHIFYVIVSKNQK